MKIIQSPSPNFNHSSYELIGTEIHKTLGLMPWTLEWLQDPTSQASCHVLFCRNGDIHELVPHNKRAWGSGRIKKPSARARKIMLKTRLGTYVKPGYYLLQAEFECLANQTFNEKQYKACVWYHKNRVNYILTAKYLLEHQDIAIDKPDLEAERAEILKRMKIKDVKKEDETKRLRSKVDSLLKLLALLIQLDKLKKLLKSLQR